MLCCIRDLDLDRLTYSTLISYPLANELVEFVFRIICILYHLNLKEVMLGIGIYVRGPLYIVGEESDRLGWQHSSTYMAYLYNVRGEGGKSPFHPGTTPAYTITVAVI